MAETNEMTPRLWVFQGTRVDRSGKRFYAWAEIAEGAVGEDLWYSKQLVPASVGGVYRVLVTVGGSSVRTRGEGSPVYERRFGEEEGEDAELVYKWAAADEAAKTALAKKSMNTKAAAYAPLDELLAPITRAAKRMNDTERKAFIATLTTAVLYAEYQR